MEPEKKSLEKEIPFGNHHFQVPCSISGEYPIIFHRFFFLTKKKSPKNQGTEAAVSWKSGSLAACTTCVLASWLWCEPTPGTIKLLRVLGKFRRKLISWSKTGQAKLVGSFLFEQTILLFEQSSWFVIFVCWVRKMAHTFRFWTVWSLEFFRLQFHHQCPGKWKEKWRFHPLGGSSNDL